MPATKSVARFQCDPGDSPDPEVTIFICKTLEVSGEKHVINDWENPIKIKLSQIGGLSDLRDIPKLLKLDADRKVAEKAAEEKATAARVAAEKAAAVSVAGGSR